MGRFETTAETYARYREPYPPAFFAAVAERLALSGRERLIDLGTGPGVLALGFRPYVGSILGVDPEPNMLAASRAAAGAEGVDFPLFVGRTEDLPPDIGAFDIVSIGRALHWMEKAPTVAVLERLLAPEGALLICGCSALKDERNPWLDAFEAVIRSWGPQEAEMRRSAYANWFDDTPFAEVDRVEVTFAQPVTPEDLFARALTRSSTSAAILGDRVEACRTELLEALAPFFPDRVRSETLKAKADIVRRR